MLVGGLFRAILSVGLQVGLRRAEIATLSVEGLHQDRGFDSLRIVRKDGATRLPSTITSRNAFASISTPPSTPTISTGRCSAR